MKDKSTVSFLSWALLFLVGLAAVVSGFRWLVVPEPWLLDKAANEKTLQMNFEQFFQSVPTARPYLTGIYRFFGVYVLGFGLYICVMAASTYRSGAKRAWYVALLLVGGMLVLNLYLIWTFVPTSPFLYLIVAAGVVLTVSLVLSARVCLRPQVS